MPTGCGTWTCRGRRCGRSTGCSGWGAASGLDRSIPPASVRSTSTTATSRKMASVLEGKREHAPPPSRPWPGRRASPGTGPNAVHSARSSRSSLAGRRCSGGSGHAGYGQSDLRSTLRALNLGQMPGHPVGRQRMPGTGIAGYIAGWRPSSVSPQAAAFAQAVVTHAAPGGQERGRHRCDPLPPAARGPVRRADIRRRPHPPAGNRRGRQGTPG
jgi:hypothetical protein